MVRLIRWWLTMVRWNFNISGAVDTVTCPLVLWQENNGLPIPSRCRRR